MEDRNFKLKPFKLCKKDFYAFNNIILFKPAFLWQFFAFPAFSTFLLNFFFPPYDEVGASLTRYFVFSFLIWGAFLIYALPAIRTAIKPWRNLFEKPIELEINERGIHTIFDDIENKYPWKNLYDIKVSKSHLFILIANNSAFIIPFNAFTDDIQKAEAIEYCNFKFAEFKKRL